MEGNGCVDAEGVQQMPWPAYFPDIFFPSLKVKTSIGNAPISKNEMEALITNYVKEYVLTNMMITILPGNRLLIDIFGKLVYLLVCER